MTESPHIVQLDEQNFMQVVVEGSDNVPVLVDFWADWCGPCKALSPVLEKLAVEYDGAFVLAMLDTEAHPGIAQQLGIRSLPTVMLFRDRQMVDQFNGALPEAQLRQFLETHVGAPAPAEEEAPVAEASAVDVAMALHEAGRSDEALAMLRQAQADEPENADVLLALGQVCIADGDLETAESCVKALPEAERDSTRGRRLAGLLALARQSPEGEDVASLEAAIAADADDHASRYRLAIATALNGDVQAGMDHLLTLVQRAPDLDDGAPRKTLLQLFDVLGEDPLAGQYRRKLFGLLN